VPLGSGEQKEGTIMKTFTNMLCDDSGASAAEYALILAIVGSALAIAAIGLGNTISSSMNKQAAKIASCSNIAADATTC
jgi:pilus assembly protein Flp/PilA